MRSVNESVLNLIGLATKAGKTVTGSAACEVSIKSAKSKLVIIAKDTSDNTRIPVRKLCEYKNLLIREFATKEELGKHTGKDIRAVVVIIDEGFAKRIIELIDTE